MPQSVDIEHCDAAIFQAEQTFQFEPVETAIGVLPRNAGERANLRLLNLKMRYQVRVEHWIEQRSNTASDMNASN
jgi:hypothetical protein